MLSIRSATAADVPILFQMVQALAAFEKLSHEVTGCAEDLEQHLFGPRPYAEAVLAEVDGTAAGFALFFHSYSTFKARPGIWLEDLFVLPEHRQQGIGKALIAHVAQVALDRRCSRFEWSVLDWNERAIGFYKKMGAEVLPDWRICRVTGDPLAVLAARSSAATAGDEA